MAERKYDLALVNTLTNKKIQDQPWYKERLKTRFIKGKNHGDVSKTLQGGSWSFLLHGLDDFRDGLPPQVEGSIVVKGSKAIEPNIHGDTPIKYPKQERVNRHRFTEEEVAYLNTMPLQQQRRDHITEMEYGLLQHPLALYPHLEESMPPDIFEDVVDILDPEMNLDSDAEDDYEDRLNNLNRVTDSTEEESVSNQSRRSSSSTKVHNPYCWLPRKEEQQEQEPQKDDRKVVNRRRSDSPSQDEHIKNVTKEFCDWVSDLGGDNNNVEESTIHSLFASGYETKPALSVPIHVVELTNVPPELRISAAVSQEEMPTQTLEQVEKTQKQLYGGYQPSWVKMKYGSWYLPPKTWSRRPIDEPLKDPQAMKDKEMSESKKKSLGMDEQLAPLHGSKSFKEFVEKKGTTCRMPEFLDRVAKFQAQAEAEELAAARSERGRESKREVEAK